MEASYTERPSRCPAVRAFLVTAYGDDGAGRLLPEVPVGCLGARDADDGRCCRVVIDHFRARKTGPGFALAVARCRVHRRSFTLYPPGFAPYRRQPLLRVGPGGEPVLEQAGTAAEDVLAADGSCHGGPDLCEFEGTLFDAALSAARGEAWARDSDQSVPDRWWSTQGRHLRLGARLVGVAQDLAMELRVKISRVLGVEALRLKDLSRRIDGDRSAGVAICQVLSSLARMPKRAFDLLLAGHLVSQWGEPVRCQGSSGTHRAAFRAGQAARGP